MSGRDPVTGKFPPRPEAPKKGEGWGGAARGEGLRIDRVSPEVADAIRALVHDPKHREAKKVVFERTALTWADVMENGDSDSNRIVAAEKLADRINGKVEQKTTIGAGTDEDGNALSSITVNFVKPSNG